MDLNVWNYHCKIPFLDTLIPLVSRSPFCPLFSHHQNIWWTIFFFKKLNTNFRTIWSNLVINTLTWRWADELYFFPLTSNGYRISLMTCLESESYYSNIMLNVIRPLVPKFFFNILPSLSFLHLHLPRMDKCVNHLQRLE